MALRILKTTDHRFEGLTLPFDIETLPPEIKYKDGVFDNYSIIDLKNGTYKLVNSNYIILVRCE